MADEESTGTELQLTFNIKSSSDQKYVVTVPETMTVLELKTKLSTTEYAEVPTERQRLIYSGRVLKDPDALSTYKIKDGNTVHMVKGAASNVRQNPASQSAAVPAVPQNIASGTGNDPLAALTGARYAGFAQMPGASTFGPDGGMGPPPNPEDMLSMLDNPMFQSQMNEAMNNPDFLRTMQNSPMFRNNPRMAQLLQNPEMRRMMMDPNIIRQSLQMQRMMNGGGDGGQGQGIAPGVTDTTPAGAAGTEPAANSTSPPPFNPFAFMGQGGTGGAAGAANPFSALFGGMNPAAASNTDTSSSTNNNSTNPTSPPAANPFASLFGGGFGGGAGQQNNPMAAMAQQMMQNPEAMNSMMASMFGDQNAGAGGAGGAGAGAGAGAGGFNPFAMFGGGAGAGADSPFPAPQQDARPPEEQYAEQLRQLNDMGFYDFTRNVRALRMSGGSVQGAVEVLLSG